MNSTHYGITSALYYTSVHQQKLFLNLHADKCDAMLSILGEN
jgi:hypothetical protein